MRQYNFVLKCVLALVVAFASQWSFAQSDTGLDRRAFGLGQPTSISELPRGPFRESLEALTPSARANALAKLQSTTFPVADLPFMRVDNGGGVFYVDPAAPAEFEADAATSGDPLIGEITEANVFKLHSKPGASRTLYIDFDGHQLIDTVWNGYSGQSVLNMLPFSLDGDPYSFSASEISRIAESWRRVAEDMSSWDIDVTTEEPPFTVLGSGRIAYASTVGHNLVTSQQDANGYYVYTQGGCGCGGVAYLGVFGNSYYQPGLSFNSGDGSNAMTISHEFGHNLNLSHDGTSTSGYYSGHGSGATSWGPIMGAPFGKSIVNWSMASYPNANNNQDDRAVITGYLPLRQDDHTDALLGEATPLVVTNGTNVVSTTRVTDPGWSSLDNKGTIEDPNDYDLFYMSIGAGTIDLAINAADADQFESNRGANLDIQARLLDATGSVLQTSNPDLATGANINYVVTSPGTYYLEITGVGRPAGTDPGYADYTSTGQYYISGTIPEDISITDAPWAPADLSAALVGENSIELGWTDPASPLTANEDGYRVYRSVNGASFALITTLPRNSEWYADNNLASGDYLYYVEAFNSVGSNSTPPTAPITIDVPRIAVATSEFTYAGSVTAGSYLSTQQASGSETLSEQHSGGRPNRRVSSLNHEWIVSGVTPGSAVTVEVTASAPANSEGDYFRFTYSVNGEAEQELGILVAGNGETNFSADLPGTTSGSVVIRVEDTDRTVGAGNTDSVSISSIRVVSSGDPGEQAPVVTIDDPADGAVVPGGPDNITLIGTALDFEDGDISPSIAWSSNVDGSLGSGSSATVTLSGGTPAVVHTITATVIDSADLISSASITVTVDDSPVATTMSVADLDGAGAFNGSGKRWSAEVVVSVADNLGAAVSGATVSGGWSGDASGTGSCVTDATGSCSIATGGLKNQSGAATFSVTGIAGALIYDDQGNSDPDGDSDGTTITITP